MITGIVEGGTTPVINSDVNLMKIGTTGYGSEASTVASTESDSMGHFTFMNPTCSAAHEVWFLIAHGGMPNGATSNNSRLTMIDVLGPCNQAPSTATINEVTTMAGTYALSQFMDTAFGLSQNIGTSSTNLLGIANASLVAHDLVDPTTGAAPGPALPAGGIAPTSEINTLANILSTCVNANDSATTPCQQLVCVVTPGGVWNGTSCNVSVTAETTLDAALQIARNPANNIASLFALQPGSPIYTPALSVAPNDWTVGLKFVAAGSKTSPSGIAIDASGDAWVTLFEGEAVVKLDPQGTVLGTFTGGGLSDCEFDAIDSSGNVWVTNENDTITELDSNGNPLSGMSGYTGGGLNESFGIALDASERVWVSSSGGILAEFCGVNVAACPMSLTTGDPISPAGGYTGGGLTAPQGVAVDGDGNVWAVNTSPLPGSLSKFSSAGSPISGSSGFTGGGLTRPTWVAFDTSGNAWVSNSNISAVSEFNKSGTALSPSGGFTGGGVSDSLAIAVDSANDIWVSNEISPTGSISEFNDSGTALSPSTGFQGGGLNDPIGIAVDASGNVWLANDFDGTVSAVVGAAAPTRTPLNELPVLP